jgi:hypothetical protein
MSITWFIAFCIFSLSNWMLYVLFLQKRHSKPLNILLVILFLVGIFLTARLQANPDWAKYVHVLSIMLMYYMFLLVTLLDFAILDKSNLPKKTMIRNIRILGIFIMAWLSANTYISYP